MGKSANEEAPETAPDVAVPDAAGADAEQLAGEVSGELCDAANAVLVALNQAHVRLRALDKEGDLSQLVAGISERFGQVHSDIGSLSARLEGEPTASPACSPPTAGSRRPAGPDSNPKSRNNP